MCQYVWCNYTVAHGSNIYNSDILVRSVIKFLDRYFLFIKKVQAFLDLILSQALGKFYETFVYLSYFNGYFWIR